MSVNYAILAGKSAILSKNSLKPPIFGGFVIEKVKNLQIFLFSAALEGGGS